MSGAARQQAISHSCRIEASFIRSAYFGCLLLPLMEVVVHLPLVAEVVTDHRVYSGQSQGGILLRDLFGGCPLAKRCDHRVERNACISAER